MSCFQTVLLALPFHLLYVLGICHLDFELVKVASPVNREFRGTGRFLESDGPIAFDSRSGVNLLTQVFGLVMVSSSTDPRVNWW